MYYFCTYFDQNYLPRGIALYNSLTRHTNSFTLYVLCLDQATYDYITSLGQINLIPIALEAFEAEDAALKAAKKNRSLIEYYFTCTPSLPLYIIDHYPQVDLITYVDADLYFYGEPTPIFEELGDNSILLIGHRFPEKRRHEEKFGLYNVGFLAVRNDEYGRACLQWWRGQCLAWCYDRLEGGKFADQKYLDEWQKRFVGVVVLQHQGANVGPWNVEQYTLRRQADTVYVNSQPLIFFHFHGVKILHYRLFEFGAVQSLISGNRILKDYIYRPYLREVANLMRQTKFASTKDVRENLLTLNRKKLVGILLYGTPFLVLGPLTVELRLISFLQPFISTGKFLKRLLAPVQPKGV